jgi:microcystin-dependent protein
MTYADDFNIRTTSVKFNDVADAVDGVITRQYATTTGTSSAFIASPNPAWQAYVTSAILIITPHTTNAAGATIQLNALPAKDMKIGGAAIPAGVLQTGVPTILAYTGTYFEVLLQNVSIPVGQITAFAGSTSPVGWLLCDASDLNTYTYRTLHAVISNIYGGTAYNPGTTDQPAAVTTFKVPDLRRRIPTGRGTSDTLGFTEGGNNTGTAYASRSMSHDHTISHTHTLPAHSHTIPAHVHGLNGHTHTVAHSHPLSDSAFAKIYVNTTPTPDTLRVYQVSTGTYSTSLNVDLGGNAGGGGPTNTTGTGLGGNTDSATPTSSGPSPSTTGGSSSDTTDFSTTGTELAVSISAQTGTTSGSTTQPYIFINYIIKY